LNASQKPVLPEPLPEKLGGAGFEAEDLSSLPK
jgi:hypothetical protein